MYILGGLVTNFFVCDSMKPAGEPGAHGNVVVIVEVDDIAEVVVLVPAGAAAVAGPLVRPEAVVGCAQMQPLQQQANMTATAMALSATAHLAGKQSMAANTSFSISLCHSSINMRQTNFL